MPQRRLSERQKHRIGQIQDRRRRRLGEEIEQALTGVGDPRPREGRVISRHGAHLAVQTPSGDRCHCLFRQNIGQPVCGDRVVLQPIDHRNGIVTAILPRQTVLGRPDYSGRHKPLAANITQLIAVFAVEPAPTGYLLDQYLVAAERVGVKAAIAVNKTDLLDPTDRSLLEARFDGYGDCGYPLLWISARSRETLAPLIRQLHGETSILVGQSGVGKSSLVKALIPDIDVQIGHLSEATGLGRHTTSAARCYQLPEGGDIIDSPGVRSFRLGPISISDLERGFREFRPFLGRCRFADCRHDREPDCALKQAVLRGRIRSERLQSFRHLAEALSD